MRYYKLDILAIYVLELKYWLYSIACINIIYSIREKIYQELVYRKEIYRKNILYQIYNIRYINRNRLTIYINNVWTATTRSTVIAILRSYRINCWNIFSILSSLFSQFYLYLDCLISLSSISIFQSSDSSPSCLFLLLFLFLLFSALLQLYTLSAFLSPNYCLC